ncbi:MAG: hypothetical protein IGQ88_11620 [Gloeomargaritaceae cyanobacterium C42_A2020_066]|nr:hypothetical protein [Gloeomargaritaceae cyanobacterium C42_A2020_066]
MPNWALGLPANPEPWQRELAEGLAARLAQLSPAAQSAPVAILEGMSPTPDQRYCPLSLELAAGRAFPEAPVFEACADWQGLRAQIATWGYATGVGKHWLPVVWTRHGPLYGEAISRPAGPASPYHQPTHWRDAQRQALYALAHTLLRHLQAPPSVYLIQFDYRQEPIFDRLWPYPGRPALASVGVQDPDLLTCQVCCWLDRPIRDLRIHPGVTWVEPAQPTPCEL